MESCTFEEKELLRTGHLFLIVKPPLTLFICLAINGIISKGLKQQVTVIIHSEEGKLLPIVWRG